MGRIFTIGHSDRGIEEFIGLLASAGIGQVVDVRKLPGSNKFPHFNADALADSLAQAPIGFTRAPELAGRRPVSREVDFETNAWWTNRSFHNYADHALGAGFSEALDQLEAQSGQQNLALMCAEAVWWRCHRRIIADHLLARGLKVRHIIDSSAPQPAALSDGAKADGLRVTYPRT